MKWINVETGEKFTGTQGDILRQTVVKKVPGKNIAIASLLTNQGGFCLYDLQTKVFEKFFYPDIGKFWFSEDGYYLFDEYLNVYHTPTASTSSYPQPVGNLQRKSDNAAYQRLLWLEHSALTDHLWALEFYGLPGSSLLVQYSANDYSYMKKYYYDEYNTTINGKTDLYRTSAHYVFANSNGSEIYLIKNVVEYYDANAWSLEWIEVK